MKSKKPISGLRGGRSRLVVLSNFVGKILQENKSNLQSKLLKTWKKYALVYVQYLLWHNMMLEPEKWRIFLLCCVLISCCWVEQGLSLDADGMRLLFRKINILPALIYEPDLDIYIYIYVIYWSFHPLNFDRARVEWIKNLCSRCIEPNLLFLSGWDKYDLSRTVNAESLCVVCICVLSDLKALYISVVAKISEFSIL